MYEENSTQNLITYSIMYVAMFLLEHIFDVGILTLKILWKTSFSENFYSVNLFDY